MSVYDAISCSLSIFIAEASSLEFVLHNLARMGHINLAVLTLVRKTRSLTQWPLVLTAPCMGGLFRIRYQFRFRLRQTVKGVGQPQGSGGLPMLTNSSHSLRCLHELGRCVT